MKKHLMRGPFKRFQGLLGRAKRNQEPEVETTRPCPHCEGQVSVGATVCIHCERELVPLMTYGEFARRFGSPHAGGPPHVEKGSDE